MTLRLTGMVLASIAIVLLAFFGFQWLNAAVSLDHARQEQQHQRDRAQLLRSLLQHTASHLSRADVVRLLTEEFGKGHVIKQQNDGIQVDDIIFRFRGDVVAKVLFLEEENPSVR
jgi:hypothetical protein